MGLLSRLFGSDKPRVATSSSDTGTRLSVDDILAKYGTLLESSEFPTPGLSVADTRALPYPKEMIENALASVIATTKNQKLREQATFGYLMLANFQDGVGPAIAGFTAQDIKLMSKSGSIRDSQMESAELIASPEWARKFERLEKWKPVVEADTRRLEAKLDRIRNAVASLRT